jgi:hypothetical protein
MAVKHPLLIYLSIDRQRNARYEEACEGTVRAGKVVAITSARTDLERQMSDISEGIDPDAVPSGAGCVECLAAGQWWFHLRRCAKCGHIGCCDTSPNQHATAHFRETGHFIITSFEPGEDWFWNYRTEQAFYGPRLSPPRSRPLDQPSPGPKERLPPNWEDYLNE